MFLYFLYFFYFFCNFCFFPLRRTFRSPFLFLFRIRWRSFAVFGPRIIFVILVWRPASFPVGVLYLLEFIGSLLDRTLKSIFAIDTESHSENGFGDELPPSIVTNRAYYSLFIVDDGSLFDGSLFDGSLFDGSLFDGSLFDGSDDDLSLKVVNLETEKDDRGCQEPDKKREKIEHLQKNWQKRSGIIPAFF